MSFNFKAVATTFPGLCLIGGIALIALSKAVDGISLVGLGVFLILAGIGLYALGLVMRYKNKSKM